MKQVEVGSQDDDLVGFGSIGHFSAHSDVRLHTKTRAPNGGNSTDPDHRLQFWEVI